ncbi:hypothetical protein ABPG74_014499 [Tetrahymena malaccensis]
MQTGPVNCIFFYISNQAFKKPKGQTTNRLKQFGKFRLYPFNKQQVSNLWICNKQQFLPDFLKQIKSGCLPNYEMSSILIINITNQLVIIFQPPHSNQRMFFNIF